mmetsp:Transcript_14866/g.22124  ORF Transcript_14866/g.22124 Transcript_14866/m.22124 type:complete len:636 (-) Transcript_14866:6-1913(-)
MKMDEKNEYARRLSTVRDIRDKAGGDLHIPQICVLGDQGSGKSSLLSSLVPGLRGVLPTGRGTQTRCPTVVRVRPGEWEEIRVGNERFASDTEEGRTNAKATLVALQEKLMADEIRKSQGKGNSVSDDESSEDEEGTAPVCDTEIVVEFVGRDVVDLDLVDLPGLIQSGPGVGKVEDMARRYIEQEFTLIVIIREADLDQERAAAVKLALEADPRQERTFQVLTKCDSFSKTEGKNEVESLVKKQPKDCSNDTSLAVHLTCCDPEGVREDEYFKVHTFSEYTNVGSRDLAERRLPGLLAQLISRCKPALLRQIRTKQEEAHNELKKIGREPKSNDVICLEFVRHLDEKIDMEEILTPTLVRFEDVSITEEWTNERHTPNDFVPSFYQGLSSFRRCVKDACEEFIQPRALDVCNDVAAHLDAILGRAVQGYSLACPSLQREFDRAWKVEAQSILQELRKQVSEKVDAERHFATANDHYLQAEYLQQLFAPDAMARVLAEAVEDEHVEASNPSHRSTTRLRDSEERAAQLEPVFKRILQNNFTALVKVNATEFQKRKLHAAVKSYWKVTRKRVSDTIMQCVRDVVIRNRWEMFRLGLPGMNTIKDACGESDTTTKRRERYIKLEKDMSECLGIAETL